MLNDLAMTFILIISLVAGLQTLGLFLWLLLEYLLTDKG